MKIVIKYTNKEINNLRKKVKKETNYNLNQIDIIVFSDNFIDYKIYKNRENDLRIGRSSIKNGRVYL